MFDETELATSEAPIGKESKEVANLLGYAAAYLGVAEVHASAGDNSPYLLQIKLTGAELQQRLLVFMLGYLSDDSPVGKGSKVAALKKELGLFWHQYDALVRQTLQRIGPRNPGVAYADELQRGVAGMAAVCEWAQAAGWRVELPSAWEDVKERIDLKLRDDGKTVKVQVKCRRSARSLEAMYEGQGSGGSTLMTVTVPDDKRYFDHSELGIPRRSTVFSNWLDYKLRLVA